MTTALIPQGKSLGQVITDALASAPSQDDNNEPIASLDPQVMGWVWHERVLDWAVEESIGDTCFRHPGLAEEHRACRDFYESLPLEKRRYQFFCLQAPEVCSTCGATWFGPAIDYENEQVLGNVCPECRNPHEPRVLQQYQWFHQLAQKVADGTNTYGRNTRGVIVELIFRLAEFVDAAMLAPYADAPGIQRFLNHATALRQALNEYGLDSTQVYDAANWVAFSEEGAVLLDWDDRVFATWNCNQKRQATSALMTAVKAHYLGKPVPRLALDDSLSHKKNMQAVKEAIANGEDFVPPQPIRFVVAQHHSRPDEAYIFMRVTPKELAILQAKGLEISATRGLDDRAFEALIGILSPRPDELPAWVVAEDAEVEA